MTKSERIQLIRTYFKEVGRIEGAVPCIQWKHLWEPNIYLYSREDESLTVNEIIVVKSPTAKVDKVLKYSIKHFFQTAEELDILLRTLSDKSIVAGKAPTPPKEAASSGSTFKSPPPQYSGFGQASAPVNPSFHHSFSPQQKFSAQPPAKKIKLNVTPKAAAVLLVLAVLLLALFTNPSEETHREAVMEMFSSELQQKPAEQYIEASMSDDDDQSTGAASAQTLEVETAAREDIPSLLVHRKNYFLFSRTELLVNGKKATIGTGLFGRVWLREPQGGSYLGYFQPEEDRDTNFTAESQTSVVRGEASEVQKALQQEMKRAIIVAMMEKRFEEYNSQDQLTYKFVFHNRSNRNVKSFHGIVLLKDTSEEEIGRINLSYDRRLGIGERAIFHVSSAYDPSREHDMLLRSRNLDDLIVEWEPEEILFNDGSELSLAQ